MIETERNIQMTCNARTITTLTASPDMTTLRDELNRVCQEIEADNVSISDLGAEIMRLGVSVSLPVEGPVSTLIGLQLLTRQLADEFPNEWQIVKAQLTSKGTA
jgi:hypothetical protein